MGHHAKKHAAAAKPALSTKEKLKIKKKERKQKLKEKRARLIVKNLAFAATPENVTEHFSKFGEVESVELLKREDGKLVGCGFVQFKAVQNAAKARHHLNGRPFLGRNVTVDFALAKDKFTKTVQLAVLEDVKVKEEPIDVDEIKQEPAEGAEVGNTSAVKEEDEGDQAKVDDDDVQEIDNSDSNSDSEDESVKDEYDDDDEIEDPEDREPQERKPHVVSNDVTEGKTVFVKNVPFSAANEDVRECMSQFGPIFYALVCMDRFTEHSKGTAFVKFRNKEDAEKALAAGTELTLMGNVLDCHPALGRNEIQDRAQKKKEDKSAPKDCRNLYLVKEGVILAGSKAAEGVSAGDMAKRLQLEQYKTQMLRNLNMFVSRERIVVHNLPATWDDSKLRTLVQKHAPKDAIIKEARIMRNMKSVDEKGVGRSKEFAFVTFATHEDAITVLRSLNNNPNVFSAGKRPIVTFSIENKAMIRTKQKRLEKSKTRNPKCKQYDPNDKKKVHPDAEKEAEAPKAEEGASEEQKFVGVTTVQGKVQKMRSRYKLTQQAKTHFENLKKEKKKKKFAKKSLKERQQEFTKQPKQKQKERKSDQSDTVSKMVSQYKKSFAAEPVAKKTKWYQ